MWTLLIYGVVIVGGIAFVETFVHNHDAKVKQGVVDVWKPLLDQQIESTKTAVSAAEQNLATAHLFRDQAKQCSDGTAALEQGAEEAKRQAALDLAAKQGRLTQLEADRKKHQQQTITPDPAGATCEQKLGTIGGIVVDLGARRLRDHPPGDESGNGSRAAAPASPNPGSDSMRITR